MIKIVVMSTKASHTQRKNFRALQFLWTMQLHVQYTPVKMRPYVYASEESGEFQVQEAAGCYQEVSFYLAHTVSHSSQYQSPSFATGSSTVFITY